MVAGQVSSVAALLRTLTNGSLSGPDGEPDTICGWGDYPACDKVEECKDDTVEIHEQNTVS